MKKRSISLIKKSRGVQCLLVSHQNLLLGGKAKKNKAAKYIIVEDYVIL